MTAVAGQALPLSRPRRGRALAVAVALTLNPWIPGAAAQPVPAVAVAPAEVTEISPSAVFTGRAVAIRKVDLRARVAGFVEARSFVEGGEVAEGAVLFAIEDDAYRAALAEIEASVAAAGAARRLADIERERQAELAGRGSAPQAALDRAEAEASRAAAEVRRLEAQRDRARLDLSYTEIRAPFGGRVGLAAVDVGALVGPDSPPLATLVRDDPMTVQFPVPERDVLAYEAARAAGAGGAVGAVTVTLADGSALGAPGRIDFADRTVGAGTDTVLMRAVFPNPDGRLRDGALVRVTLRAEASETALTVPQQAVQRDLQGDFVMVVDAEGVVEQRRVGVARRLDGLAVIAQGLAAGEAVIVEGVNKARPGGRVDAAVLGSGG